MANVRARSGSGVDPPGHGWWQWMKFGALGLGLRYDKNADGTSVWISTASGAAPPRFFLDGNPFDLTANRTTEVPLGTTLDAGEDATIRGFGYGTAQGETWTASRLSPISAADFLAILSTPDTDAAYRRLVALFDSNDRFRGNGESERFEPGGGSDRVVAGGGDDTVHKWRPGNLTYDGGTGRDTLDFGTSFASDRFPTAAAETLRIDLAEGTGRSPWGGRLTLKSVERILDTDARDVVLGSARSEVVKSDYGGGDVFRLRGGNDRVELFGTAKDLTYDGGRGRDTLQIALGAGDSTLHLGDSGRNSGVFDGARITSVEQVSASSIWVGSTFTFVGTGRAERVTFAAGAFAGEPLPRADLRLGGGNDRVLGGLGDDRISGGRGRDVLDGGPGDDVLFGGSGRDLFQFAAGLGRDRVPDFDPSLDRLDFRGHDGVDRLRDLTIRQSGDDVTISDGAGGRVTLEDVDRGDIGGDLFLF